MNLEEYEEVCPRCKGSGIDPVKLYLLCSKCKGSGKIDWLEKIFGSKRKYKHCYDSSGISHYGILEK